MIIKKEKDDLVDNDEIKNSINFTKEIITSAGNELLNRFSQNLKISIKNDNTIVTDADLASEELIIKNINKFYPKDIILSEEKGLSSNIRKSGEKIWIIDPLDGTTNFSNNYPFFFFFFARGVFDENGKIDILIGAVFDPIKNNLYTASKKNGAYFNDKKIVKQINNSDLSKAFLATGFVSEFDKNLLTKNTKYGNLLKKCNNIRKDGAAALDLALVANGIFDAYWEYNLKIWDQAAGFLLVKEVGYDIVNYNYLNNYNLEGQGIVAGKKNILDQLKKFII